MIIGVDTDRETYMELLEENRQLRRALWLARADRAYAKMESYETESLIWNGREDNINKWHNVYLKCRAMADKFKEEK